MVYIMILNTAFKRPFSDFEILALVRILCGFCIFSYYVFTILPDWNLLYGSFGLVDPDAFAFSPPSWIFFIWELDWLKLVLLVFTVILSLGFSLGIFAKACLLFLLPLHLGFHLANPMITHEPHLLNNILLFVLFFLPVDEVWALKRGPAFMRPLDLKCLHYILWALLTFISLYYFFAGIKKLPDAHWLKGDAVSLIMSWPYLSKGTVLNQWFQIPWISKFASISTLLFECLFIFIIFTPLRRFLIPIGLSFHLGVALTLDLGQFFFSMLQWYPLLLLSYAQNKSFISTHQSS